MIQPHTVIDNMETITVCNIGRGTSMTLQCTHDAFKAGMKNYNRGAMIQEAFAFLSADEREFLMSGLTPDEWEALYGWDMLNELEDAEDPKDWEMSGEETV